MVYVSLMLSASAYIYPIPFKDAMAFTARPPGHLNLQLRRRISTPGHDDRQNKPEDVTVYLLRCFMQYALALCLDQLSYDGSQVWARCLDHGCLESVWRSHGEKPG